MNRSWNCLGCRAFNDLYVYLTTPYTYCICVLQMI